MIKNKRISAPTYLFPVFADEEEPEHVDDLHAQHEVHTDAQARLADEGRRHVGRFGDACNTSF